MATACANPPAGRARWTLELLAPLATQIGEFGSAPYSQIEKPRLTSTTNQSPTSVRVSIPGPERNAAAAPNRLARFKLECMAGFAGIRTMTLQISTLRT